MSEAARLTRLLDHRLIGRLERLRLRPARFTSKRPGERLSRERGRSTDFSDYRDYVPGDDIRAVDWNIFARLHRPYVKLYHREEEQHLALVVDASTSMLFEGKLERALSIAAAFATLGLAGALRVSITAGGAGDEAPARLAPCGGRASRDRVYACLEELGGGGRSRSRGCSRASPPATPGAGWRWCSRTSSRRPTCPGP